MPADDYAGNSMRYFAQRQRRTNLPVQVTSFVGRTRELDEVEQLLRANRMVTIVGSAGAGKTRLALQVAEGLVGEHEDGPWWVELANSAGGQEVVTAFCDALRPGRSTLSTRQSLLDAIQFRELLLVVDNCESAIEPISTLLAEVLRQCPSARVLVTSREPLAISAEIVWRIPPMRVVAATDQDNNVYSEALELFEQRAAAVSNFRLTAESALTVRSICTRLDGLPLAIELAAAQMSHESATKLAAELPGCIPSMRSPYRTTNLRHQTLTAAIAWSYERLDRSQQRLIRLLSTFAPPIRVSDVAATYGTMANESDLRGALNALADKSLIERAAHNNETSFRLLDSIRVLRVISSSCSSFGACDGDTHSRASLRHSGGRVESG